MAEQGPHTTQLHRWLERMRAGDNAAQDELVRSVLHRMEQLARKMLKSFPKVHRWAETGDVLQESLLRLLRSLQEVNPGSMREFYGLAAEQIRRQLLDLTRHFFGPEGLAAHHTSHIKGANSQHALDRVPDETADPEELERWRAFHEEVARLPSEQREIVDLVFYQGWTQVEAAEFLGVTERTVRSRWKRALLKLHTFMKEEGLQP
jgi:RNA polymerase sigma-70 factor (ECF subfamily)